MTELVTLLKRAAFDCPECGMTKQTFLDVVAEIERLSEELHRCKGKIREMQNRHAYGCQRESEKKP